MPIDVRPITDDELAEFYRVEGAGFGFIPHSDAGVEQERTVIDVDRCLACFDGTQMVGTAAAYSFAMTVPGSAQVPVGAVTAVTVSATHRRRGLLRMMMAHQLDDVAGRGEPMAVLNASESSIYRRFGYGLASFYALWSIDTAASAFAVPVDDGDPALALRLVRKDEALAAVSGIYDRWRLTRPGSMSQSEAWWQIVLGDRVSWKGGGDVFVVACDPFDGTRGAGSEGARAHGGGYALYTMDNRHDAGDWKLDVRELVATDPRVEARLWRYLLDVDLVSTMTALAPIDDPLRWRLADPRQLHTTDVRDYLFVRLVDVEASLRARRYATADAFVIDVHDAFRPVVSGRYRVEGGPDDAACQRVGYDGPADLVVDVADLGSLYLGGVRASDLVRAGRIHASTPDVVARADAFFAWPVAPFCFTRF